MKASERFTKITNKTGLYNIQAIDNVPSIMQRGLLSNEKARNITHVSIAMNEVQSIRKHVVIPDGLKLHQYASLYFDARNPMLYKRKDQNEDLCILKFNRTLLDLEGVIISDRNASSGYAAFYTPEVGLERIDFELVYAGYWTDSDYFEHRRRKSIKCAEVLVPYCIPYYYVMCAAVVNEKAAVRLKGAGFDKKIFIKSDEFF